MASSTLLATLLIAVATIQITLATYYSTCDPPRHPDYGGYSPYNNKYYVGSKIKFYCKPGYRQYGPSSSTCKEYNKRVYWTHQPPVCKPIAIPQCKNLDHPLYGEVEVNGYTHGSSAYYVCKSGYKLVGNAYRKCYNGDWTGNEPVCDKIVKCPRRYHPRYGYVRVTGYYYPGSTAYYHCRRGYEIYGEARQTCLDTGYWGGRVPVCKKIVRCPDLDDPPYGSVNQTGNKPGDTAHYECDDGLKLVGDEYRDCLKTGYWSGEEPICKKIIRCPDLDDPPYGSVNQGGNKPGDTAYYECNKGFKLVGDRHQKCLKTGYWNGSEPVCKRAICSYLVAPRYGKVNQRGNTPSSKAYYSCNYGYQLHGLKWRECLYNGTWNGDAPVCRPVVKKVTCPHPDAPSYGKIRLTGYSPRSKAYYSCDDGYQIYGQQWRWCKHDGTWSGNPPVCKKTCPHPGAPIYGKVQVYGNKAYYSCNTGYKLYGLQWRKCLDNGSWYGSAPTCYPAKSHYD